MPSEKAEQRKLAAIMFTDMVGYSALSQLSEALALELLEEHRRVVRELLPRHGGREVKTTGDGFLLEFPSALAAVQGAVEIQNALDERNQVSPPERQIRIRIGIHVGDVVMKDGDIYGDVVNIAARIEPLAAAGGICISSAVHEQVRNKLSQSMAVLGSTELKNIELPMLVHRVVMPWDQSRSSRRESAHSQWKLKGQSLLTYRARWAEIAAFVLLAAGLGWWLKHQSEQAQQPGASSTGTSTEVTDQKSIAVLPFVNMSADKTDEYLSEGMTMILIDKLGNVPGLRVLGRSSSFVFKGRTEDGILRKVGEQLRVSTVLEGDVLKVSDKLRITARLINVADGMVLWSQPYDGDMKDILEFQSSVAQRVVGALQVKLGDEVARALSKAPTENPEAHRLYLLGRYHFGKYTDTSMTNAIKYFTKALQKDTNYTLAYCGLADCYGWMGGGLLSGKEAWAKEKELAQKALDLDPNLADAHLSLGIASFSAFDWKGGEQEMKRALELNPKLALAYDQLGWAQSLLGRFDEGTRNKQKAINLDPLSVMFNSDFGWQLSVSGRYDEGVEQLRRTLEFDPNYAHAHLELGWCSVYKGDMAGAITAFKKAQALDPGPWFASALAYAYARVGDRAKAEQVVRDLNYRAKQRYITPGLQMLLHLGLGETDKALDWLEKCYEEQDGYCWALKVMPIFDPLRTEPRFRALLKKIGLDP